MLEYSNNIFTGKS